MNRRLRYSICYAAMGLMNPKASLNSRKSAYRSALNEGLSVEDNALGLANAQAQQDQDALAALCNKIIDEVEAETPSA